MLETMRVNSGREGVVQGGVCRIIILCYLPINKQFTIFLLVCFMSNILINSATRFPFGPVLLRVYACITGEAFPTPCFTGEGLGPVCHEKKGPWDAISGVDPYIDTPDLGKRLRGPFLKASKRACLYRGSLILKKTPSGETWTDR